MKRPQASLSDNSNKNDDEFDKIIDEFISSEFSDANTINEDIINDDEKKPEQEEVVDEDELKKLFGDSVSLESFRFHCQTDDNPAQYVVEGMIESFQPQEYTYIHVDLELHSLQIEQELKVIITSASDHKKLECSWNKDSIAMFHDGNHLHIPPFRMSDLVYTNYYSLDAGKTDSLILKLYSSNKLLLKNEVLIMGPWPTSESLYQSGTSIDEKLENIKNMPGMEALKKRINEMVVRCNVNKLRAEAGLTEICPNLHTILIGGIGSGQSACVSVLADIYKSLGLLSSDTIQTFNVTNLMTDTINGGADNMTHKIRDTYGGVLVFENANELYKAEYKYSDTEPQIIRALIDSLREAKDKTNWMLILTGFEEGLENLFAANPELKSFFTPPIYIDKYKSQELFRLVDPILNENNLKITDAARRKLEMYIQHKQNHSGLGVENANLIRNIFNDQIIPAMFGRINAIDKPSICQMEQIEIQDIPELNNSMGDAMAQLDAMVGLGGLKKKIHDYLNVIRLVNLRLEKGLPTKMPRLHMAFLGNPGTGKTTVAKIIGKIFASWGILSTGHVIRTEKSQMVGQYIGETEFKMRNLLARAKGNVLFIDEAYQLIVEGNEKDHGRIVMNSLLTELGNDESDMVVILAGYTAPMKKLLESNEGIESRFPNVFNFEDYTTDELMEIAHIMVKEQGLVLTEGAESNMRAIFEEASQKPSPRFGNGRFVSNLIQNQILATMGTRLSSVDNPTEEQLITILPEDVVIGKELKDLVFDNVAIDAALTRLDALSGLDNVKKAVRNFVQSARYLHSIGEPFVGKGLLSWRFIGKSGTGKSTVAEIMAAILKGMHLIANSNITQFKAERLLRVSDHDFNQMLQDVVKKSCNGLIFIDADESQLGISKNNYASFVESIRLKLEELTIEVGGECALILAELDAPNKTVAEQLTDSGIYEFDHTLVFKDFTPDELYEILCNCLKKFKITFTLAAENHIKKYITTLSSYYEANARTMKLMSRTIHQQVILRESGLTRRPKEHQVQLADIETFKWNSRKGRVGY